jgi:hypothetical protein
MSAKEAIATYLGLDYAETFLYQRHNWNHPIVTCDNDWYTATNGSQPTLRSNTGIVISDLEKAGQVAEKTIWKYTP